MANQLMIEALFIKLDTNRDKHLSGAVVRDFFMNMASNGQHVGRKEFQQGMENMLGVYPERADKIFDKIDTNRDDYITEDEVRQLFPRRRLTDADRISRDEFIDSLVNKLV